MLGKLIDREQGLYCVAQHDKEVDVTTLARICDFRMGDLAGLLKVSERHLERSFKNVLEMTPKSWLREQRMIYAKELFEKGMDKRQVSAITGFKSYSHFAAEIATFFGKKPKEMELCA